MIQEIDVPVRMRDGVHLSTDIRYPEAGGPFPTIVIRHCYSNSILKNVPMDLINRGYAIVIQDCRGRFDSEGTFNPFHEDADGHDAIAWVMTQPWCNGKIGMTGGSYAATTQLGAAWTNPPGLEAIMPSVAGFDLFKDYVYHDGAFALLGAINWGTSVAGRGAQLNSTTDWQRVHKHLPLITVDEAAGYRLDFYKEWLSHPTYDSFWAARSPEQHYGQCNVPAFHVGGWYDFFSRGVFRNYCGLREHGGDHARKHQRILVGPWRHGVNQKMPGQIDFGENVTIGLADLEKRWFDRWLRDEDNGIDRGPPVRIFVMGENVWRDEHEWPLARTRSTAVYLKSQGRANSLHGDGALSLDPVPGGETDSYVYNPENPVPTVGGSVPHGDIVPSGPTDHAPIERRDDVLVYTGDVLRKPLEVTGPVQMKLFAGSDAPDTDFVARLCDLYPDGRSIILCDGIVRARFREGFDEEKMMEPGKVYEFEIDMSVTSNVFFPGHALRVEVTSSCFPRFSRNLNTGDPVATGTRIVCARQTVHHSSSCPSHLILPVIPRD